MDKGAKSDKPGKGPKPLPNPRDANSHVKYVPRGGGKGPKK